ncbi:MAG: threonine/serine dehydratase [Acidobacteriaceae bacterium]
MLTRNQSLNLGKDSSALVSLTEIRAAQQRVCGIARRTPLIEADFSENKRIYLKAESLQPIGSFKLRGAYNKAASIPAEALRRGLITYSSGNHGQGVAYAARALGAKAVVVMPSNAPAIKRKAAEALGAEIVIVGPGSLERKTKAEELAELNGYTVVPPYDDPAIIAGQGTCGFEILEDLPEVDLVLVPVGGGGLLSGIAAAIKQIRPATQVWGVEPELAADAAASIASGKIVSYTPEQTSRTLADGLRTQHVGELNFAHLRAFVEGIVTVSETEIASAMRALLFEAKLVAEPSGAVAVAVALYHAQELQAAGKTICAVVSGGNVEPSVLRNLLDAAI